MMQYWFEKHREIQARRAEDGFDGFTLIELLIVIVVLGVLAAVVIFALSGVTGQSKAAACNADAKSVETAVAAYEASATNANGSPPTNMKALVPDYLHSEPSATVANNGYQITMTGGVVSVTTAKKTEPYDTNNLCTGLAS